ncbi:MAG TPA: M20 family metallopeptidase [Gammaproteobacteria bacterium]|jgi:acetylornithine deacetylase/succinyl-diaminopimelate desuccinylase-like protein
MNSHNTIAVDTRAAQAFVADAFERSIIPALVEYIKIPNKSPAFDPDWEKNGHMRRAMDLIVAWCHEYRLDGMQLEVVQLPGRTPLLFIEVPGEIDDTILLYGHMDKQPETTGWREGLGPWKPVLQGDRLYGRGGADDGYSTFASLAALNLLARQNLGHARCVILIESSEESGSPDLPYYVDHLRARIGAPSLVVCLDSGAGNYDQLWCTTSLRGLVNGNLHVDVIHEGVHSGDASGIVPSSFRIARLLLSRLERESDGVILPERLHVQIPRERIEQAKRAAEVLGDRVWDHFPWQEGARPVVADCVELTLNRTWRPALEITGARGLPDVGNAGNVMRPSTSVRVSLRLPPGVAAESALRLITDLLTKDPPYGARVRFEPENPSTGWNAPPLAPWLEGAIMESSKAYFGKPAMYLGEGGTIPFIHMLGDTFPSAQFLITGVLGPEANAHGPNEFLHLPTAQKLTCCVADTIRRHALRPEKR